MAIALSISKPVIALPLMSRVVIGYFLLYFNNQFKVVNFTSDPYIHLIIALILALIVGFILPGNSEMEVIKPKSISVSTIMITNSVPENADEIIISSRGIFAIKKEN